MKYYLKFLVVGIVCGVLCMLGYAVRIDEFVCSDIIRLFGMYEIKYFMQYLSNIAYWFMPLLFFQIFFGTYIYRHFCCASIYYFSRYTKRTKWYVKEVLDLFLFAIIYLFMMISCGIICCTLISDVIFDVNTIKILCFYLLIYSLYLFVTTLGVNIVAILCNSNVGFMVVEGINMFFIVLFTIVGEFFASDGIILKEYEWILKINPIYYLMFGLNNGVNDYLIAAFIYLILAVIILCWGGFVINRHNFIESDNEIGGM